MENFLKTVDPQGNCTEKTYTVYGKESRATYPNGSTESKEYTLEGLLCKEVAKNGVVTTIAHDFLGREVEKKVFDKEGKVLKSTTSIYNTFHLISETDEEGITTHYSYDSTGRLNKVVRLEKVVEYRYDAQGRRTHTVEWADDETARVTIQVFDQLDQVIEERVEDLEGNLYKKQEYILILPETAHMSFLGHPHILPLIHLRENLFLKWMLREMKHIITIPLGITLK